MIQSYQIGLIAKKETGCEFSCSTTVQVQAFRPNRLLTNLKESGVAALKSVKVDGKKMLIVNPGDDGVDLYEFSLHLAEEMDREFLEKNELIGQSEEQIQDWLDDNDMGMPSSRIGRLDLPTVKRGMKIEVSGTFVSVADRFTLPISICGYAEE